MTSELGRPADVLLVEDNPGDVLLTREAFADARIAIEIADVGDSDAAIAYLDERLAAGTHLPDLVLLDLNLPGRPGLAVLEHVRQHDAMCHIPVIMLTSSKAPDDIMAAYRGHANSFITKPVHAEEFLEAVRSLEDYWLTVVRLPST